MREAKTRIGDLAALAILAVLITAAFADVLFFGANLYFRDFCSSWYPSRIIIRDIVASGSFPFWNDAWSAGQPLAANPAYQLFYPLQWLALLPNARFAIHFQIYIHYCLAAAGMYIFLRCLSLRPAASFFGAITFALGGALLSLSNLPAALLPAAWLPWLAYTARRLLLTPSFRWFCAATLILGTILLAGEQALILQSGFLIVAFAIHRMPGDRIRPLGLVIALIGGALILSSVQIVPALDLERDSARAEGLGYPIASEWSMAIARPLELAFPNAFGRLGEYMFFWGGARLYGNTRLPWMLSFYPGLLAFVLMTTGFLARVRGAALVAIIAVASYAMAIGDHGPIFPLLYRTGLRSVRYPEKFFLTAIFVLTIFAALTAERILDDLRTSRIATIVAAVVAFVALVWALITVTPGYSEMFGRVWNLKGYYGDFVVESRSGAIITVAVAALLAILLFLRRALPLRVWIALLALFVVADLGIRVRGLMPKIGNAFYDPPPIARALSPGARIYNDADWQRRFFPKVHIPADRQWWVLRNAMRPETQSIWGFDGVLEEDVPFANLRATVDFARAFWSARFAGRNDRVPLLLTMAGTTHVIEERPGEAAASLDPVRLIALPGNTRYYFAERIVRAPFFESILSKNGWPPHAVFSDLSFISAPGRIDEAVERPNSIDLDVEAAGDSLLVVAVTRHKYWRATLDGAAAAIHPANAGFQAVVVPRGRHHITLRYRNPLVIIFGIVSLLGLAALLSAYFVAEHRSRRRHIE